MKQRNGFVSNSSSSSFIIESHRMDFIPHPSGEPNRVLPKYVRRITKKQEKLLLSFGFKLESWDDEKMYNFTLDIVCNQDCVMKYLITHKIPFKATCHYGQEYYEWDGKSKDIIFLNNFGEMFSMYSSYKKDIKAFMEEKAGHYIPITTITDCECEHMDGCTIHTEG